MLEIILKKLSPCESTSIIFDPPSPAQVFSDIFDKNSHGSDPKLFLQKHPFKIEKGIFLTFLQQR